MKTLPSKELIREVVFREDVFTYENLDTCRGFAITYDECGFGKYMSYFELADKCKKWASKHGVNIWSWLNNAEIIDGHNCYEKSFTGDTEQEAIFKACEWIMEQTK